MKSFAVLAAVAGVAVAQNLGDCAQLCVNNMARIANSEFSCGANDIQCFCTKSNWAYGIRDCTAQACDSQQNQQAVSWASGQCGDVAAPSGTDLAAVPILSSALAGVSSGVASVTGSAASAASAASSAASDAASGASSLTGSLASEASSAASSAASAASSAVASASDALSSATGSLASRASSATQSAGAPSTSNGAAPMITGMPIAAVAGFAALFL